LRTVPICIGKRLVVSFFVGAIPLPKNSAIGLGSTACTTLAEARAKRDALNAALANGEPILGARKKRLAGANGGDTFGVFVEMAWPVETKDFKQEKDRQAWRQSLVEYAQPLFAIPVNAIQPMDVADSLKPIWNDKQATARHVRARIATVLNHARAAGVRKGGNPAEFKLVVRLLGKQNGKTEPRAAMPLDALPGFIAHLRKLETVPARALEFCILTATRTNETLGATWAEIDGSTWSIPLARMKTGKKATQPHKVPLCARALAILAEMKGQGGEFVFSKTGKAMNEKTLLRLLQSYAPDATTHGFRSVFKEWAVNKSGINDADSLSEYAISHKPDNESKAAYIRTMGFEARGPMMQAWADYLTPRPALKVVSA
jgi:integrase